MLLKKQQSIPLSSKNISLVEPSTRKTAVVSSSTTAVSFQSIYHILLFFRSITASVRQAKFSIDSASPRIRSSQPKE